VKSENKSQKKSTQAQPVKQKKRDLEATLKQVNICQIAIRIERKEIQTAFLKIFIDLFIRTAGFFRRATEIWRS